MKKKSAAAFTKFSQKKSNAAIKEQFRQEKKKWKKEREEFFDRKKAEARGVPVKGEPKIQREDTGLMPLN
jgi:23S rRNA pseudouridine2605 synthase